MKQVVYHRTGGPEVLEIRNTEIPKIKKDEVLVRMLATSVNGGDVMLRRGSLGKNRQFKKPKTLGIDVVGVVEKTGANVTDFQVGDQVWGNSGPGNGTTAEYYAIPAKKVSLMPESMDPLEAAALPTVGITAITALIDVGKIKSGERVLIQGVGGVGFVAVQIAKAHGAHVTALASGKVVEDVKKIGADEVYDYRKMPVEKLEQFDLIFDTAGTALNEIRKHLTKDGRMVTVVVGKIGNAMTSMIHGKQRIRLALGFSTHKRLDYLKKLVNSGKVTPVIDSVYPMEQIEKAHARAEERGIFGKIIIQIAKA